MVIISFVIEELLSIIDSVLSSSSGLGHHPLTVEIAGSIPAGSELKMFPKSRDRGLDPAAGSESILYSPSCMDTRPGNTFNKERSFMVYLNEHIKAPTIIVLDES